MGPDLAGLVSTFSSVDEACFAAWLFVRNRGGPGSVLSDGVSRGAFVYVRAESFRFSEVQALA